MAGEHEQKTGGPGAFSRWLQRRANTGRVARIRRKGGTSMGMELLVLHTVGHRSGQPHQTPVAWFPGGDAGRLVVASGGGNRNPDWCANLLTNPDRASVEFHGSGPVRVTPTRLAGSEREQAWQRIAADKPRIATYQRRSDRVYPVIRLTRR
ncbi:nitroreductase family deazaflavin-dependent oxidoreductase [Prauserella oleivorans]|uniref:Nitroreductase family deazaflavin-dependent oxidoreductase n=1 Tax=Prauserella oleivorans TaxID=1478153 RepID=A0ABW5WCM4_9PSEU